MAGKAGDIPATGGNGVGRKAKSGHRNNGLNAKVDYSDDLAAVIGKGPMARSDITAKVWDYIKAHQLQAADDKRQIEPDALLARVVGKDRLSMFKMTAEISKHIQKS